MIEATHSAGPSTSEEEMTMADDERDRREDLERRLFTRRQVVKGGGAAAGAVGYLLTDNWKGGAGAGLAVLGAVQLPYVLKEGGLTRLVIGAAAFAGAYMVLKDISPMLGGQSSAWPNEYDDDFEENEEDDDDLDEAKPGRNKAGAKASDDPDRPSAASPFMRPRPTVGEETD